MERVDIVGLYLIQSPSEELAVEESEMARESKMMNIPTHLRL